MIPPAASSDPPAPLQSHHMSKSPFLQAFFSLYVQVNSEVSLPFLKFYFLFVCVYIVYEF